MPERLPELERGLQDVEGPDHVGLRGTAGASDACASFTSAPVSRTLRWSGEAAGGVCNACVAVQRSMLILDCAIWLSLQPRPPGHLPRAHHAPSAAPRRALCVAATDLEVLLGGEGPARLEGRAEVHDDLAACGRAAHLGLYPIVTSQHS
jgi:hypothetical protein